MVNHVPLTFTGSLKLTVMFASMRTLVALLPGVVLETNGAISLPPPPPPPVEKRGFGAPTVKSALLSFVSWLPLLFLKTAVVLDGAGAGAVPSKQLAPP